MLSTSLFPHLLLLFRRNLSKASDVMPTLHATSNNEPTGESEPTVGTMKDGRHSTPIQKICLLVEPSPITYVCGYANRFQALLQYWATLQGVQPLLITTEVVVKERPAFYRGISIRYTPGLRLPRYPLVSLSFDYTWSAFRAIRRQRPDVIHVVTPGLLVFTAVLCSRLFQIPLVMSYHTHLPVYLQSYLTPKWFSRLIEWLTWQAIGMVHSMADLTLVTSPQILDEFQQHGVPRCEVWQKGIDAVDRFHPRHDSLEMRQRMSDGNVNDLLLVYIGRLASEKRIQDLRAVLASLDDNTRLCIVGTGPQEDELHQYFKGTRTVFLGQLTGLELSQAFASGDVFCMTSDSETLGFVVLESMASGVPVVAAEAGGIPDLIEDGTTGFLVPPGDVEAFVNRIRRLQSDSQLRKDMTDKGRLEMERWSWQASMEKLHQEQYERARRNFENRLERRLWRGLTRTRRKKKD